MIKLLMTWDIKPGRETAYLDFVSQHFTPSLIRLGLELSEVWYTYWGDGPHILVGFISQDMDAIKQVLDNSRLIPKYNEEVDRDSAYEMLNKKLDTAEKLAKKEKEKETKTKTTKRRTSTRKEKSTFDKMVNSTAGRTIVREITRGLLGVLGLRR